ncbi:amino acid ABC transporter ATP-binding protein, PAAT family [Paracoccus denitrificans]|jgi:polar amino acid transport system ATP-binding protein|uniref:Amino acid ABC transporter ATP-binding protein, PAAT family n=3 Tax=Paracoccaceae TaxID=31989 RepID=A1BB35_PARDP|nr:amino acid ABC transporter ATP-binding protein, PAAT family [Paracoccus denitrificans PD1222]MBB4626207.1 polar amino acid transport system ATP-binding protein [Paracoccus denitrificans]GEK66500.1 ABC transporter ATP-binding protein [Paracoccus denitrificans]SDH89755.1 amino acid ABC transporter ATP-binding protein, PAAT family [Paracoccus denitrificans]SFQ94327.1 amino acid ABC transporter ATP-binding protein, PAAT family [Paracoccus denitrificans]
MNEAAIPRIQSKDSPAMSGSSQPMVRFHNLRKSYGAVEVLKGIDLEVSSGQVVALIGRSGSGKSTALRCVNGLERFQAGELHVCGYDLSAKDLNLRNLRQDVGIVFQSYNLFPHLTVEQNVTLAPRKVKGVGHTEARELAKEVLAQVGLSDKVDAYPEQLSGGQQQRVAIARSLAMKPKLMLFDEVTSALDPELTGEVLRTIERLAADGMTMMLVTHEMAFARSVADQVVFMHQGRVWEAGPGDMLLDPQTVELRQFVGSGL